MACKSVRKDGRLLPHKANGQNELQTTTGTVGGILEAALELAQRHEEILARLRIAVSKGSTREIVRVAKELVAHDEKGD